MKPSLSAIGVCLLAISLLTGCASSYEYVPYSGVQKQWPTREGAFVKEIHGIPIYHSWPDRPYTVLGKFAGDADEGQIAYLVKTKKADAAIIIDTASHHAGSVSLPAGSAYLTVPVEDSISSGFLIRFDQSKRSDSAIGNQLSAINKDTP